MSALPVTPLATYKKPLSTLEQRFIGDQWAITDFHPVDNLSREECIQWLARVGLSPAQQPQPVYEQPIQHNEASEQSLVDAFSQSLRDNGLEDFAAAPPQALSSLEHQQLVLAAPRQPSPSPIPPRHTCSNRYATSRSAPHLTRSRSKRLAGAAEAAQRNSVLNGIVTMDRGTGRGWGRGRANGKRTGKAKAKARPMDIAEENDDEDVKMESSLPPQIEQWPASVVVVVDSAHHSSPAPVPALALVSPVASSSLLPLSTLSSAAAPSPILPTQSNIPAPTELVQRTVRVLPKHGPYTIACRSERIVAQRGGVPAQVLAAPVTKINSKRKAAKKAAKKRVVEPNAEAGPSRTCHRGGTPVIASIMDVEVDINIDIAQLNRERIVTLSTPSEAVLAHTPISSEPVPLTSSPPLALQTTPVITPVQPPATTTARFPRPANPTVTYGSDTDALPYPSPTPRLVAAHLPSRLQSRSSSSSSDMMEPLELEYPSPSTAVYGHQSTAPQYLNIPSLIPVATRVTGPNEDRLYTMHPIDNDGVEDQLDKEKDQQQNDVTVKEEEEDQLGLDQKVLRILMKAHAMADEQVHNGADVGVKPVADANQHASISSRRSRGPSSQSRRPKRYNPYERTRGNSADAYSSPSPTCSVPPASNSFFNARPRSLRSRQKRRRHDLGVLEEIREAEAEVDGDDEDEGDYAPERDEVAPEVTVKEKEVEMTIKHKLEEG